MDKVRVNSDGLHELAARCAAAAGELSMSVLTPLQGPSHQATSAAVASTHRAMTDASGVLAARVSATGAKFSAAASDYLRQDHSSGESIAAFGAAIEA